MPTWKEMLALAQDSGGDFINAPRGAHVMKIVKSEAAKTSEATGKKDMYKVIFKVVSGPHEGATHPHNFVVSPDSPTALGIVFRYFSALGIGPDFLGAEPEPTPAQVSAALLGRIATVTIGDDRRDATRTAVTNIAKADGNTPVTRDAGGGDDPFAVFKPVTPEAQAAATSDGAAPPALPF
jgi:hypothetical protein